MRERLQVPRDMRFVKGRHGQLIPNLADSTGEAETL